MGPAGGVASAGGMFSTQSALPAGGMLLTVGVTVGGGRLLLVGGMLSPAGMLPTGGMCSGALAAAMITPPLVTPLPKAGKSSLKSDGKTVKGKKGSKQQKLQFPVKQNKKTTLRKSAKKEAKAAAKAKKQDTLAKWKIVINNSDVVPWQGSGGEKQVPHKLFEVIC